jgi:hypothetical protein
MNNVHRYGFRWSVAANGGRPCPVPVERRVATAYAALADTGGTDYVGLSVGDPVGHLATGYIELANNGDICWGVIVGFKQFYSNSKLVNGDYVPQGTAYGTNLSRATIAYVVPVTAGIWEIDADENTTATTYAAYFALIGGNYPFTCPGLNVGGTKPQADPHLDISEGATTAGLPWRLEGISPTFDNRDFSGTYVKLLVSSNASQNAGVAATPVVGVV